jgi:hypothetical protein
MSVDIKSLEDVKKGYSSPYSLQDIRLFRSLPQATINKRRSLRGNIAKSSSAREAFSFNGGISYICVIVTILLIVVLIWIFRKKLKSFCLDVYSLVVGLFRKKSILTGGESYSYYQPSYNYNVYDVYDKNDSKDYSSYDYDKVEMKYEEPNVERKGFTGGFTDTLF